ncbi:TRAP transporter fused permease subunit [Halobacillus shinanisalinarum]|uniref:TRAP transporter fused permease subunit n=1 Tax=Halobacillus shinanisalinarum TaxID=2932258 RepID=A0ABY4H314_9BACI|nr:TRAP transporter fused permease subunit [Halobacillus shinanisalinarum]UOQ94749.1 TRAP transporter fused permease subunit [Halobacillus shinanisalinarum]
MAQQEKSRFRTLNGVSLIIWRSLLFAIPVSGILYILSVHQYLGIALFLEQYTGLFLAFILAGVFIGVPAASSCSSNRVPWYDWILAAAGFSVGFYISIYYPDIVLRFGYVTTDRFIVSLLGITLIMESLRRLFGWSLVIVVGAFMFYALVPSIFPGPLKGERVSLDQFFNYLFVDANSLLFMLNIASTIALAFILFGQVLLKFGGGSMFNDFAFAVFGRYRGGPAKASVVGSSLVGSVSGGPVSNVVLTGSMTIPLMIKNGFSRREAGAIESVASTGGIIMPPVMGIAAFIIAQNLGVPYVEVMIAAIIPALLYYLCIFVQVDLRAASKGLVGLPKEQLPSIRKVLKTGWMIVPIFAVLLYLLFVAGYTPTTSGVYTAFIALLILLLQRKYRKKLWKRIWDTLIGTGETLLEIGIILGAAGLVIGIVGITGLGFNLALLLTQIGESNLILLLATSAIVSIILGMGMPAVAAYALVATLVAPSLVELGVHPMAAHLFVFYFSTVSSFTPPIAVAAFAAASIAKESPYKIGFSAMGLGIAALIVPFLFVYSPSLLLGVGDDISVLTRVISILTAILGCFILSVSVAGFLFSSLHALKRVLVAASGLFLLFPVVEGLQYTWVLNVAGFGLFTILLLAELRFRTNDKKHHSDQSRSPEKII